MHDDVTMQWRIQTFHLGGGEGGGHEMRLNAKGTIGSMGGRKLICNKIITPRELSGVWEGEN